MRMPGVIDFMHSGTGSPTEGEPWAQAVERARKLLQACNLPVAAGFYYPKNDGTWVRDPRSDRVLDCMNRGEDIHTVIDQTNSLDTEAYAERFRSVTRFAENLFGWGSDQQYAAQVLYLARRLELARQEQLMQACGVIAFQLGVLTESWRLAQSEGHARITGSRVIMGGRRAAEKTNGSPDQRRVRSGTSRYCG